MSDPQGASPPDAAERARILELARVFAGLKEQLATRIVGQEHVIRQVLASLLSEGHCLLVGVPGLAKTLLIRSIAELVSLEFKRIQFTPDLMPSDITGATLIQDDPDGLRGYHFLRGPIFANVILADEINRTPPKTQSALMEAMEERQVTASGRRLPLPRPFFVLATENPVEQEGTYPLPVSQLDRFQQTVRIDYPEVDEEFLIVQMTTSSYHAELSPILDHDGLVEAIALTSRIAVAPALLDYAARMVRRTRPDSADAPEFVKESISWGAGPRAVQSLVAAGRAIALLDGRPEVTHEDLHAVAHSTLRHRIVRTYHAEAEGHDPDTLIDQVLESLPEGLYRRPSADADTPRSGLLARWLRRASSQNAPR